MTTLAAILTGAAGVYAVLCVLLWAFQDRLVFFPTSGPYAATPDAMNLSWRDLELRTEDGETITGWFVEGPSANAPAVLYLHGNAGNMSHRLGRLATLRELGLAILMIDYRGYGTSTGRPSETGLQRDAQAAWNWLEEEGGYPGERIVLFGRSLGASVAAHLAARADPAALVLESAFTDLPALADHHYGLLPAARLTRYGFDTRAALARSTCPVLLAHSPDDEIVPFVHAERLASVRPEATERVRLSGGHNAATLSADPAWRARFSAFVQRHAAGDAP